MTPEEQDLIDLVDAGEPLPEGVHHLSEPWIHGPTSGFKTTVLRGAGKPYNSVVNPNWPSSTVLVADFDDAPAVTMVGGRNSVVRDLGIVGQLPILYQQNLLNTPDREGWPGVFDRYNPYAGLVVDRGDRPSSEHTLIENVEIGGFYLGFGTKVDGSDGNGDYNTLRNCRFAGNVIAIDICHPQARCLRVDGGEVIYCHTFLTNRAHGLQAGCLEARVEGVGFNTIFQLCDVAQGTSGPVFFSGGHAELLGWLGNFTTGGNRNAVRTTFHDLAIVQDLPCHPGLLADGGALLLDGGFYKTDDVPVFGSQVDIRGTLFRTHYYDHNSPYDLGDRKLANGHPVIGRSTTYKPLTQWVDCGNTSYFPNLDEPWQWPEQHQIQKTGRWKSAEHVACAKPDAVYDSVTETITFNVPWMAPAVGDVIQDDVALTTWVVWEASGMVAKLRRRNNHGAEIDTANGNWYRVRSA